MGNNNNNNNNTSLVLNSYNSGYPPKEFFDKFKKRDGSYNERKIKKALKTEIVTAAEVVRDAEYEDGRWLSDDVLKKVINKIYKDFKGNAKSYYDYTVMLEKMYETEFDDMVDLFYGPEYDYLWR